MEGFDPDTPLFVASGIFSAMDALAEANMAVVRRELASHVFHKSQASLFGLGTRRVPAHAHPGASCSCTGLLPCFEFFNASHLTAFSHQVRDTS